MLKNWVEFSLGAMLPPAKSIAPLDPEEFLAALEYANMVAGHEFLEEIPAIGKPLIQTDEGALALTNIPESRAIGRTKTFAYRIHEMPLPN
jgi:hypothetical protein